jgi:hypothetical protein
VSTVILAKDSATLTPARAELARINVQIAAVEAERDEAQRLVGQWEGPASEMVTVERRLADLRAQRERDRAEWNDAGCPGDPPVDPPDLLTLERARARLRESLANEAVVQAAAETAQRAQERRDALILQKRSAHLRATVEAVRERLEDHAIPAMIASMNELAALQSIGGALAGQGDPEATSASREIDLIIKEARGSYGVRGDLEPARHFLEELAGDPAAQIPDPRPAIVERLDPAIPRPGVQDGTKNFNWGPRPGSPDVGLPEPAVTAELQPWLESSTPTFMPSPRRNDVNDSRAL